MLAESSHKICVAFSHSSKSDSKTKDHTLGILIFFDSPGQVEGFYQWAYSCENSLVQDFAFKLESPTTQMAELANKKLIAAIAEGKSMPIFCGMLDTSATVESSGRKVHKLEDSYIRIERANRRLLDECSELDAQEGKLASELKEKMKKSSLCVRHGVRILNALTEACDLSISGCDQLRAGVDAGGNGNQEALISSIRDMVSFIGPNWMWMEDCLKL
ncbi:hypothetical protein FRC11_014483 [Ceratobasidium sp. 423]|nr:hypothetical protein FRC11_014483 [Ceratobasidium sp. 423]